MKKTISILAVALMIAVLFCSCKKDMGRMNYNYDMSKIVELDTFEIEVDPSSDNYKEYYSEKVSEMLVGKLTQGKVQKDDIANIDYVGKKDGVAFEGGTANGYDLKIGSGSFIAGFEDGLIGAEIGSTVDLNLTFPSDYGSAELAGKAVVFTVKVNFVERPFGELNEETAKICGYKSVEEVETAAKAYATEGAAWDACYDNAKIEYPEKETEIYFDFLMYNVEMQVVQGYGITLDQYLQYSGMTKADFEKKIRESSDIKSLSHNYALSYYILDKTDTKIDTKKVEDKIKEYGEDIVKNIGKEYIEASVAFEMAMEIVAEKATVK
ncbi:MAG: FKBP-type peptidyl-prolyl cis-trans isomerase [Clostridia bacterium]|nr:FKBP-type peptidyl-prolyl cis-trans isomerase [Clostridia bacterium]